MCFYYLDFNFIYLASNPENYWDFLDMRPGLLVTPPSIPLTLFRSESEFHTLFQMDILYPRKCTVIHDTWRTISLSHTTWPSRTQIASLFWLRFKIDHYRKYHSILLRLQNVIRIATKCNTKVKCNNIDAKCNKIFNAKCNNLSTQIVITFLTHNVITQNVIISE